LLGLLLGRGLGGGALLGLLLGRGLGGGALLGLLLGRGADHHELLAVQAFHFQPQTAIAGGVRRIAALRNDPFEP
jgi:hypothetical protein